MTEMQYLPHRQLELEMGEQVDESVSELIILCANVRSLGGKINEIQNIAIDEKADVMIFVETWASDNKNNNEYHIEGYKIALREDKKSTT